MSLGGKEGRKKRKEKKKKGGRKNALCIDRGNQEKSDIFFLSPFFLFLSLSIFC